MQEEDEATQSGRGHVTDDAENLIENVQSRDDRRAKQRAYQQKRRALIKSTETAGEAALRKDK
jgi:hypothetical protein